MNRLIILAVSVLASSAVSVRADVVSEWVALAERSPDGQPTPPPPLQDQTMRTAPALVALAVFEAVNRIDPRYRSYIGVEPAKGGGVPEAAAASAAHAVLVKLRPAEKARLDEALMLSLAAVPEGPARAAGIALGSETAAAVLARTLFEGPEPEPYRPRGLPGEFAPPMPSVLGQWTLRAQPFFLTSAEEVMPPPPPALTTDRYARDLGEVKRIGGVGQPGATPATKSVARFIGGFDLDPLVVDAGARKPRLVDRARLWALVRMAHHDTNAMIAAAKIRYMTWRPWNAIRNADRDDNPATERDAAWEPVLSTPNHPEYPCGHCAVSGLTAALLAPELDPPFTIHSHSMPWSAGMTFADWPGFLDAASLARIQGGMHFRFSNEAGQAMGRRIGELARQRFAPPLR